MNNSSTSKKMTGIKNNTIVEEQEQLVSFDTAVLAKKKGFSWECRDFYNPTQDDILIEDSLLENYNEKHCVSSPTQSLLQKWLRDYGHGDWAILVYLVPYVSKKPRMEQCFIWRRGELITLEPKNTYEEALEEGLQEALKLIQS